MHPVTYAAIDFSDQTTFWVFYSPEGGQRMRELLNDSWGPIYLYDLLGLFSNQDAKKKLDVKPYEILTSQDHETDKFKFVGERWPGFVTLERYRLESKQTPNGLELGLELIWSCQETPAVDFDLKLKIVDGQKTIFEKVLPINYSMFPPREWKKGTTILNRFTILVPSTTLGKGSAGILFGLVQRHDGRIIPFQSGTAPGAGDSSFKISSGESFSKVPDHGSRAVTRDVT
jgi:hypothetical protein